MEPQKSLSIIIEELGAIGFSEAMIAQKVGSSQATIHRIKRRQGDTSRYQLGPRLEAFYRKEMRKHRERSK